MHSIARRSSIVASADGKGLVCQAGGLLLIETLRVTGLNQGMSQALRRWRAPRAVHDPGKIVTDLAMALALGGDCLADIATLRGSPELFGPIASDPTVSRLVTTLAERDRRRCGRSAPPAPPAPPPGRGPGTWPVSAPPAAAAR